MEGLAFPQTDKVFFRISSGDNFPDPEQRSFPSPDSVLRGIQRRKRHDGTTRRQSDNGQIVKRQAVGGGGGRTFPDFFQLSQSEQAIPRPQFPNTQAQIGSTDFGSGGFQNPTFGGFQQFRRKRNHNKNLFDANYDFIDQVSIL